MKKIFVLCCLVIMSMIVTGCGPITIHNAKVNDVVTFGSCDGVPLRWKVVRIEGEKKMLLLQGAFGRFLYNGVSRGNLGVLDWSSSTLRKFLNTTFLLKIFSMEEVNSIVTYQHRQNVMDKIFVLGEREMMEVFKGGVEHQCKPINLSIEYETWYDKDNGNTSYFLNSVYSDTIRYVDSKGEICDGKKDRRFAVRPACWVDCGREK